MHFKEQTVSPDYISDRGINEKLINRSIKAYSTLTFSCLSIQLQPSSDVNGIYFVMILYVDYFLQFLLPFLQKGLLSCQTKTCPDYTNCTHPVRGRCCPLCNRCLYQGVTYQSGQHFKPDICVECLCQVTGRMWHRITT